MPSLLLLWRGGLGCGIDVSNGGWIKEESSATVVVVVGVEGVVFFVCRFFFFARHPCNRRILFDDDSEGFEDISLEREVALILIAYVHMIILMRVAVHTSSELLL